MDRMYRRGGFRTVFLVTIAVPLASLVAACSESGGTTTKVPIDAQADFATLPDFALARDDAAVPESSGDQGGDQTAGDDGPTDVPVTDTPTQEAGPEVTPDGASCVAGQPCDDGNACTINDQCVAGSCAGSPLQCPDDGLPCTSAQCQGGACVTVIASGFCAIDGACWTAGQPNPVGGCASCDPSVNATTWSSSGTACDDGDPCTHTDTCIPGGGCAGTPIVCPASGNPCGLNQCVGGVCQLVATGNGGACDDGDSCTLGETCTGGVCGGGAPKDSDMDGAVDQLCGGTDCNDGTNLIGPAVSEVCADLLDNDCDGQTDAADTDCQATACTYHTDCYPDVCGYQPDTGTTACSEVCAGKADCAPGQVCTKLPGSSQVGYCHAPIGGVAGKVDGAACASPGECQSGLCPSGTCVPGCLNETSCPGADTCGLVGDLSAGIILGACQANGTQFPNGSACLVGGTYDSAICASGHCDLMTGEPYLCQPLCKTQSDCASNQVCDIIIYSSTPNPVALIYDPFIETNGTADQKTPRDTATACNTRLVQGAFKQDGATCSLPSECLGGKCVGLLPGDPTTYCTRLCTADSDCGSGMSCKIEMVTVVSDFLAAWDTPQPNWWTYARVCKFE